MTYIPVPEKTRVAGYKGLRPHPSTGYLANYYSTADPTIRGADTQFTVGLLHLVRKHTNFEATPAALFDCHDNASLGYRAANLGAVPPGLTGLYTADVEAVTASSDPVDFSDPTFVSPAHHIIACELQLTAIVVDDDLYPGDAFHINSRDHGNPAWTAGNPSSQDLFLGRGTPADSYGSTFDWIVGFFYHTEAMTQDELFLLRQDVEILKDLPTTSKLGGTVPDHVWSVKQAMDVGTSSAPATWTSVGAVGGINFSLSGSLDVVDIGTNFGVR